LVRYRPATAQEEAANYIRNNPQAVQKGVNLAVAAAKDNPEVAKAVRFWLSFIITYYYYYYTLLSFHPPFHPLLVVTA